MTSLPLARAGTVAFGGHLPDAAGLDGAVRELHLALPFTRITDYGMDAADARELLWRTARGEDWSSVGVEIGRRQLDRSDRSVEDGRTATAREAARAAVAAFNVAQLPITFDEPAKHAVYQTHQEAVGRYASCRGGMEHVRLAYAGGAVEGWLMLPVRDVAGTVVVWGGLSGWGASFLSAAENLAARGMACILAEGPGQGATRLRSRIYGAEATLDGFARFVDFAVTDDRLARRPVGIQGNSIGGLIAARVATRDERVSACILNSAVPTLTIPPTGAARDQILAFTGTTEPDVADDVLRGLWFESERHRIRVPLLVLHGGADPLVAENDIKGFLAGADHEETAMAVWPDGEHTLYNHASERDAMGADWFAARLARK